MQLGLLSAGGVLVDGALGGDLVNFLDGRLERFGRLAGIPAADRLVERANREPDLGLAGTITGPAFSVLTDPLLVG